MKGFCFRHRVFGTGAIYAENNQPSWMLHIENRWFWLDHVLALAVGQSTETEWHKIVRIK